MKNVLVTGGAGFVGSHLVEGLLRRGDRVVVLDDESTGSFDNLSAVADEPRLRCVAGDAGDATTLGNLLEGIDQVYHLAAAVGVRLVDQQPIESIERNIGPTQLLLAEMHRRQQDRPGMQLFLASSSEVYGKNPGAAWTEDDDLVLGPTSRSRWSYGASKAIDEFLALAYFRQHNLSVVIGRFFNVVGPRQTGQYGMVLPRFVDAALAGQSPRVHDDGSQVRCFAHVADICQAVLGLMECPAAVGQVVNIGSDQPISIRDLARRVVNIVDPQLEIAFEGYHQAFSADFEDVRSRVPDLSKLRGLIDFRPRYDLDAAIRDVVAWKQGG